MIASAATLRKLQPVTPFVERSKAEGMTFGLSHAGYDIRVVEDLILWPLWGRLASTVEWFEVPNNMVGIVYNKSSNARRFIIQHTTVLEPGWKGFLTLELSRFLPWPVRIKAGTPIAQVLFHYTDLPCEPYSGKYQNQNAGPQPAILEDH